MKRCRYSIDGKCTNDAVACKKCNSIEFEMKSCIPFQRSRILLDEDGGIEVKECYEYNLSEKKMKCSWNYFVILNNEHSMHNIVEDVEVPGDGIPLCCDFTVAKSFTSPGELVEWVKENTSLALEDGDYHIEGHYLPDGR